ncbi:helix-turn-helix domain-containing protein [Streptomyces sp. NPDC003007]
MGRRENAVAADTRQAAALARWLRAQRERSGLTYAAMAKLTDHEFTASALSRGASGRVVPTRRLMLAFTAVCGADSDEALRLWMAARRAREDRRRRAGISPEFQDLAKTVRSALLHPENVDSFGQLHGVMIEMRARRGQPTLSELQAVAGCAPDGRHRLPKSSLSVILRGEAVPSREHLTAFMEAMNVSPSGVRRWQEVWDKLSGKATRRPLTAAAKVTNAPPGEDPVGHRTLYTQVGLGPLDDLGFPHIPLTARLSSDPSARRGPRTARPPAGKTRAGLPVRRPRRYTLTYRVTDSQIIGVITLQPREAPDDFPADFWRPGLSPVLQAQLASSVTAQGSTAVAQEATHRPAKRPFIVLRRDRRRDHTRWPNF